MMLRERERSRFPISQVVARIEMLQPCNFQRISPQQARGAEPALGIAFGSDGKPITRERQRNRLLRPIRTKAHHLGLSKVDAGIENREGPFLELFSDNWVCPSFGIANTNLQV